MQEQVIGILGGMGPEATSNCFDKIIRNTPVRSDQEHLSVIIASNPKAPDRTIAILENGPSPLQVMIDGCQSLKQAGADFIIIPCVTAHYFLDELQKAIDLPVVSVLDAVTEHINRNYPQVKTIGLMGTNGTIKSGIFQKRLAADNFETVVCDEAIQKQVMTAIYNIKNDRFNNIQKGIVSDLCIAARFLIEQGAQGIIAGCTEIPLMLGQENIEVPYFDSLLILARTAIRRAGREPFCSTSTIAMV